MARYSTGLTQLKSALKFSCGTGILPVLGGLDAHPTISCQFKGQVTTKI
jgi:hypothetical protein